MPAPRSLSRLAAASLAAAAVVSTGLVLRARADDSPPAPAVASDLVVHEWGTFTSVQGADGVTLEGVSHEEEPLPSFVYSREKVRECPLRAKGYKGLEVPAEHVTQKMETPVLYFHTATAKRVRVRVDFVGGLVTQWYPVSDLLGPPEGERGDGPLDLRTVKRSFLQWDVDLVPASEHEPAEVPVVGDSEPWALARKVDAAYVRTVPRKRPERLGPTEAEHYLFYRGLGTFSLPMSVAVDDDGRVSFRNGSPHVVPQVFAIEVRAGGREGRFAIGRSIDAGATAQDLLRDEPFVAWPDDGRVAFGLKDEVEKILHGMGMEHDEARAMVATWSRSWFSREGLRVLYVVPRPLVDALLPLSISPAPAKVERVLLGRIECVTPAAQKEVEQALSDIQRAADGRETDARKSEAAMARVDRTGRFLEPTLRRILATTADADVRAGAERLLEKAALGTANAEGR